MAGRLGVRTEGGLSGSRSGLHDHVAVPRVPLRTVVRLLQDDLALRRKPVVRRPHDFRVAPPVHVGNLLIDRSALRLALLLALGLDVEVVDGQHERQRDGGTAEDAQVVVLGVLHRRSVSGVV